jgi:hypothetical protein
LYDLEMSIFAIDPGSTESAYVLYEPNSLKLIEFGKVPNRRMLELVTNRFHTGLDVLVIEKIESYGMAVGAEIFETVYWSGIFAYAYGGGLAGLNRVVRMPRRAVKLHLCGSPRAKDSNIRQSLIDKFGPGKEKAIGKKASMGPLYGVTADCWAALAVAVTYAETKNDERAV